jgi:Na+:H+ antiporter, NhaA family
MTQGPHLPSEAQLADVAPIDSLMAPIRRFLRVEAASGFLLLAAAVVALLLANSSAAESVAKFWKTLVGFQIGEFEFRLSLKHIIDDGLMVIFFFVIGLEVKREIALGELRELRRAALPLAAALGGMIFPAGIYLLLQAGREGMRGWGIPMATDIAFVVGCMAVLGRRVPHGLRVLILSLAIVDDIGAILVIAIGYTDAIHWNWLALGFAGLGFVWLLGKFGVRSFLVYTIVGICIWFCIHESGVHATIAGVALGLLTPARSRLSESTVSRLLVRAKGVIGGDEWQQDHHRAERLMRFQQSTREVISPLEYLIHLLHPWVSFIIMPLFALANAGVPLKLADLAAPVAVAVSLGLLLGKPLGIVLLSWLAVKLRVAALPEGVSWRHLVAGGILGGIGFTMALFIAELALKDTLLDTAKVGVLAGSFVSAIVGIMMLKLFSNTPAADQMTAAKHD